MKKGLLAIVFAIGMIGTTNAQTQDFCFSDGFGYTASVTATWLGYGNWSLSGTANVLTGYDWSISGSLNKSTDTWTMTFTNTMPDGCTFYVDYFTYTSTSHGGGIYFNWTSYCAAGALGSGTGYTSFNTGLCPVRLAETVAAGPSMSDLALANTSSEFKGVENGSSIFDLLVEPSLDVVKTDNNNFVIGYELLDNSDVTINIYNQVGQIVGTVVNGNQTKGYYVSNFDASSIENGMYVAVMTVGNGSISKQFVK